MAPPLDAAVPGEETQLGAAPFFAWPAYLLRTYPFADSAGKARLEVLFGLVNDILQFEKISAARYRAIYEVNLAVFDTHGNCIASRAWRRSLEVDDFSATNDRTRLNLESAAFRLLPDDYQLHIEIVDLHTRRCLRRQYALALPDFHNGKLQLSALTLREREQGGAGVTTAAACNLTALLQLGKSPQFLYYEIYGGSNGHLLTAEHTILSGQGDTLAFWSKTLAATAGPLKCVESLDGKFERHGMHSLRVQVKDGNTVASAGLDLTVHALGSRQQTDFSGLSQELAHAPLRYISSEHDYQRLLAAYGARRDSLIAAFWQERDPTPSTVANELQSEFYRRVAVAETSFAARGEEEQGWRTDRGRIYIIYGPPHEVQVRTAERDRLVYQIWLYPEIERRFIFREREGSGRFELINR
ncbi:MAG: GWxTD domain-containing protein [bacterium]